MHISYEDAAALDRQLEVFRQGDVLKADSRYLFDKLLHNDYVLKPERLGPAELKILVSLAEPARTISSIVHLFRQKPDPDLYASPVEAAHYYVARVKALADFCRTAEWGSATSMRSCCKPRRSGCCPVCRTGSRWIRP
jgi:hypothetical protein